MTKPALVEKLIRARRTGWSTFGVVAWLCFPLYVVLFIDPRSTGLMVVAAVQIVVAGYLTRHSWRSYRFSKRLERAVAMGRVAPVQVTLSRHEYDVRAEGSAVWLASLTVERDDHSRDVCGLTGLAEWDGTPIWGVPLPGTAYLDDDGDWLAIETAHGVVHR